jgi:hypothetical protein
MADTVFGIGDIAFFNNIRHRILFISEEMVVMCDMDTTKTIVSSLPCGAFVQFIEAGVCEIIPKEDPRVVDVSMLSEAAARDYRERKEVISAVRKEYGPTYLGLNGKTPKPVVNQILQKTGRTSKWFWQIVRRFLQGGMTDESLLNETRDFSNRTFSAKPGPKGQYGVVTSFIVSKNCEDAFSYGLDWYKSGRAKSFSKAYAEMNSKYFSTKTVVDGQFRKELLPITERPSYKQFYHWCHARLSPEEKDAIKTSRQEQRNDNRVLYCEDSFGAEYPGEKVEVDALEVDLSLVSLVNWGQTVGRPIVYAMRDCITHAIVAVSVSFENNSVLGITNLLLNLADDKTELCRKLGLEVENIDMVWPSHFIPSNVYFDQGSDFKSNKIKDILSKENLDVQRHLVSAASGSLKGLIEQWFHQIHADINAHTENHGLIEKRHDSKHHEEATLTVAEFTRMLYICLISYNQKHMDGYNRTAEMARDKVDATPAVLWKYLKDKKGDPRPITDKSDYLFKVLKPVQAKISRQGIELPKTHLRYFNYTDNDLTGRMYAAGDKKKVFDLKIDPRNNACVYYIGSKGTLQTAELADIAWMQSVKGLSFKETEDLIKSNKISNAEARQRNDQINADKAEAYDAIVSDAAAQRKGIKPRTDNMMEAREKERGLINQMNSVASRMADAESTKVSKNTPQTESKTDILSENIESDYYAALED